MLIVTLKTVDILGSEPISFSSLSPIEYKAKASREAFQEAEKVEILFKEYLAIQ